MVDDCKRVCAWVLNLHLIEITDVYGLSLFYLESFCGVSPPPFSIATEVPNKGEKKEENLPLTSNRFSNLSSQWMTHE